MTDIVQKVEQEAEKLEEELTIMLRKPVEFAGTVYDKLVLREPTAGQLIEWAKFEGHEADLKAISIVSGVPELAVKLIGTRDFTKAANYISRFL